MLLNIFFQDFISLFFPRECAGCGRVLIKEEPFVCLDCWYHLPFTNFHEYPDNDTARQLWGKMPFEQACSFLLLQQDSRVERILYQIKYRNQPGLATYFGMLYGKQLAQTESYKQIDLIVPIPLHKSKLRKRGYNQAYHFALGLSQSMAVPVVENGLVRIKNTVSQTGMQRLARYENVTAIFQCTDAISALQDLHILLVDDVLTTGATIVEAALTLQAVAKDCRISVVTLARA